jgi:hypothetical protein
MSSTTPLSLSDLAALSVDDLLDQAAETASTMAALSGRFAALAGELDRREGWRIEGATSLENWIVARTGVSVPTARAQAHVAQRLFDLPHLAGSLSAGDISFDKVRALVDTATPERDAELTDLAAETSVVELAQLARRRAMTAPGAQPPDEGRDRRSVRFNDTCRTMTAQLGAVAYAEVRACLEARAKDVPSDGETRWDQRMADALVGLVRSTTTSSNDTKGASSALVVAHTPLATLLDDDADRPGELEGAGLIDAHVVRRLACEGTVIVAADDDAGHTMYEGRQRRFPNPAQRRELIRRDRHCRFPGCFHVLFCVPHHLRRWKPDHGPTDLDNLVLLCEHHHHAVHSNDWNASGDANGEVTFVGPNGRVEVTRPSVLWTSVTRTRTG